MERLRTWFDRTRLAYALVAVALAAGGWYLASGGRTAPETPPSAAASVRTVPVPADPVLVHVTGAVRRPGVYTLQEGARAAAAVRRAGGPTRRADLSGLNLAAPVADGQQIVVPVRGAAPAAAPGPQAGGTAGPVSLSRATAADLEALDGIGPTLAARIIRWREENGPFASVDDLRDVPGIGEVRLETLRAQVVP